MKIESITPQIAALYLGQKCTVTGNNSAILSAYYGDGESVTIIPNFLQELVNGRCEAVLHLRPLSTITEVEAREVYLAFYGVPYKQEKSFSKISCVGFWGMNVEGVVGSIISGHIGSPAIWLKLLEMGFDMFGLIESGLAKEIGNGTKK